MIEKPTNKNESESQLTRIVNNVADYLLDAFATDGERGNRYPTAEYLTTELLLYINEDPSEMVKELITNNHSKLVKLILDNLDVKRKVRKYEIEKVMENAANDARAKFIQERTNGLIKRDPTLDFGSDI